MESVLVVDDEESIQTIVADVVTAPDLELYRAGTGAAGLQIADDIGPEVVLLDLKLPDMHGLQILKELKSRHPETAVVIITGFGQIALAVEAIKNGATDFLEKPFELAKLRLAVDRALDEVRARREIQRLHALDRNNHGASQLIGDSEATDRLRKMVDQLAASEAHTILIQGESGTGKELVAKGLHYGSSRREMPFIELNCAAIPETLFESELFGHEKGAFTDAKATKKGLIELADHGTLFLDEVSEMSLTIQAKFLRCLQERVVKRVGGTRDIRIDVRIIAATNRQLEEFVRAGKFREDLFYRLNVIPISIPPLRERRRDIVPLARYFLVEANRQFHKAIKGLAPATELMLTEYGWPGNVRELKNLIERLVILASEDVIEPGQLPHPFAPSVAGNALFGLEEPLMTLAEAERHHIIRVMERVRGNKSRAARILGISRQTLRKKLDEERPDSILTSDQSLTTPAVLV